MEMKMKMKNKDTTNTNTSRRRFTAAALAATPVLMTLPNRPAFAQALNQNCMSTNVMASLAPGNLSAAPNSQLQRDEYDRLIELSGQPGAIVTEVGADTCVTVPTQATSRFSKWKDLWNRQ